METDEYIIKSIIAEHNIPNIAYSIYEKKKPRFLREKAIELGVPVGPAFGKLHSGQEVEVDGKIIKPEQVLGPHLLKTVTFLFMKQLTRMPTKTRQLKIAIPHQRKLQK